MDPRARHHTRDVGRKTIDELLAEARGRIERLEPEEAARAVDAGARLVDLRSDDERRRHGVVPGSYHVPRSVLEWRLDPDCAFRNPALADLEAHVILLCAEGYSSSLAAATLRELGFSRVSDVVGGFEAWKAKGLATRPAVAEARQPALPGMAPPEPSA